MFPKIKVSFNILYTHYLAVSFNQPNLSSVATWDRNGITFANTSIIGWYPKDIFIDTKNSIYVISDDKKQILIWHNNSINPTQNISANFQFLSSIFVTSNGDIYISASHPTHRVMRWISETNTFAIVMNVARTCFGIFIDINDNLYCSSSNTHSVIKKNLNSPSTDEIVVAGINVRGSASNQLDSPAGTFVDVNFDLFVADHWNDRIQLFPFGETNGITVAGRQSARRTIKLNGPTEITLDAAKYLFIVDHKGRRIVGEGPYGFRCLIGCYRYDSRSNELFLKSMSFDSYGNIFVVDTKNHRIMKFQLMNISSAVSYNQPKFCNTAIWDRDGTTFANESTFGGTLMNVFIHRNNSIYVVSIGKDQILVWHNNSVNPTQTISTNFSSSVPALFVTSNRDIYIIAVYPSYDIMRWISETNTFTIVKNAPRGCSDIFIDINDNLYCSKSGTHSVIKKNLNSPSTDEIVVAGINVRGSASNQLDSPAGIFVDVNFDLFVADYKNDRIQLFPFGQSNGITVAGWRSVYSTIELNGPSGITLDAAKYLFIVDSFNKRIVGEGPYGFRCIIECYGCGFPFSMSFDSFGNIFVF
ncbi:unnamed protein product, partial [Adineta ricciae]